MIPLVVCHAYAADDAVAAAMIAGGVAVLGWIAGRKGGPRWFWAGLLISLFLPCADLLGLWPFSSAWKDDCGATPDPAMLTIMAALISPVLFGMTLLISKWLQRSRPR